MSANNRIRWEGLDELKAELRQMPEHLRTEASQIVRSHAEGARDDIRNTYPERTGTLRARLTITINAGSRFGAGAILKNTAPHAYIFEHGTQARHTELGANRGSMPAGNVFIPAIIRWRRKMYEALADLLTRQGFTVRGING